MIFRQVHGSVLFLLICIVGKDWQLPHGNLLIHLLNKKNAGLRLRPLRCGQIFLSGTLKMLFLPYRHYLMMKKQLAAKPKEDPLLPGSKVRFKRKEWMVKELKEKGMVEIQRPYSKVTKKVAQRKVSRWDEKDPNVKKKS